MHRERSVERESADGARPPRVDLAQGGIHGLNGDEAQAVIHEMGDDVGEHHQPRSEPEPPDHAALPHPRRALIARLPASRAPLRRARRQITPISVANERALVRIPRALFDLMRGMAGGEAWRVQTRTRWSRSGI